MRLTSRWTGGGSLSFGKFRLCSLSGRAGAAGAKKARSRAGPMDRPRPAAAGGECEIPAPAVDLSSVLRSRPAPFRRASRESGRGPASWSADNRRPRPGRTRLVCDQVSWRLTGRTASMLTFQTPFLRRPVFRDRNPLGYRPARGHVNRPTPQNRAETPRSGPSDGCPSRKPSAVAPAAHALDGPRGGRPGVRGSLAGAIRAGPWFRSAGRS